MRRNRHAYSAAPTLKARAINHRVIMLEGIFEVAVVGIFMTGKISRINLASARETYESSISA